MKTEHTKLPWKEMNSHKPGVRDIVSFGNDEPQNRKWICEIPPSDTDDAAFIVRACNAHDDLLAACKAALAYVPIDAANSATGRNIHAMVQQAIAKAEGRA